MGELTPLQHIMLNSSGRIPMWVIWTREVLPSRLEVISTVWPPDNSTRAAPSRHHGVVARVAVIIQVCGPVLPTQVS
jgi:hypothetical protein